MKYKFRKPNPLNFSTKIILCILGLFASVHVFNHFNVWLGFVIAFIAGYQFTRIIKNKFF
jgi:hypothetical protein